MIGKMLGHYKIAGHPGTECRKYRRRKTVSSGPLFLSWLEELKRQVRMRSGSSEASALPGGTDMRTHRGFRAFQLAFILIILPTFCRAQEQPQFTVEQQRELLLNGKIAKSKQLEVGVTRSYKLTLSDGAITHDAHFQSINERQGFKQLDRGGEMNFVDSYLYNIAAYELAKLIGIDDMVPVTVQRKCEGKTGALAWWVTSQMTEGQRREKKISPPDLQSYNKAMHKIVVFTELIYDTDRYNPGNILIGNNWELYMIDFTRAFRQHHDLKNPGNLVRCSRPLLEKLRGLDSEVVTASLGKYLNKKEVEGVMKRRDKIVAHFDKLIAEKGEAAILYE